MNNKIEMGKSRFTDLLLTFFFIGLIFSSYLAISEEYVAVCSLLSARSLFKKNKFKLSHGVIWALFVSYYFIATIVGMIIGLVDLKGFLELIIQYPCIILILTVITRKTNNMKRSLEIFKGFIFLSAIYGLIESVLRHNIIPDIFTTPVMERIATMNLLSYKYQSSSIYLHYSLFGIFLLVGISINMAYPYGKSIYNFLFFALCVVDLYFCKSRMCLLALLLLLLYDICSRKKITMAMVKRLLIILLGISGLFLLFGKYLILALAAINNRFSVVFRYGFEYGSLGQRVGTLLNVPSYMLKYPVRALFGTGYDSIKLAFLKEYSFFADYGIADNQLTTFLIEVGIIGTIIAIWGMVSFYISNKTKRCLSKYILLIMLFSSITIDVIGTIYITALVMYPFVLYYEYERKSQNV